MSQICNYLDSCRTKYLWAKVRDVVAQTLDSMTLADLLAESSSENGAQFIALSDIHVGVNNGNNGLAFERSVTG
jgi:Rrf2 family transcriptional regulator, cysteine metabolism repressor